MTLTSNKLKVVALPADNKGDPEALAEKIDYIEAEGDVKVTQQDKLATSERADILPKGTENNPLWSSDCQPGQEQNTRVIS